MPELNLDELADAAAEGNKQAVDALVRAVVDDIYWLALRMLWHPDDARLETSAATPESSDLLEMIEALAG